MAAKLYRLAREQNRKVLTTNYVIAELAALLTSPLRVPRARQIEFIQSLKNSPHVQIIHVDIALDQQAWALLRSHQDKDWSLVDCASFVLLKRIGIQEALASDRHFEQAGFERLLK